jgi:tyrosyl-tRNA synthetase
METHESKIDELLTRGVDKIYPTKEALQEILLSGKKLKLYQGFDPTGTQLHIGHMVGLRKHRQWQDLGHEVVFLIGDGTGQAGDPTGKKKTREKFFTREELRDNAKEYVAQASKIVRFDGPNPVKIMYNGDWLDKLTKVEMLDIAQNFSVQQLLERDMFQERLKAGETINVREFLYPLLQGYDSVAMDVDLEIGGTDQTFNMLAGRTLMKAMKGKEKFVMTLPILADSKGVKIGKSEGNVIGLTDVPSDLFGKIMSLGDDVIISLFTLLTDVPEEEIKSFDVSKDALNLKKRAAREIITQLYSENDAMEAQKSFENTFSQGGVPEDITTITTKSDELMSDVLLAHNMIESKMDFKRLVEEGAVTNTDTGEKVTDFKHTALAGAYKIGKRRFVKIVN